MKADTKNSQAADANEEESIDKIRDILFGAQVREAERKFSKIEEGFSKELQDMRTETRNRLDALEDFFKNEIKALTDRLMTEQNSRMDAVKELTGGLKTLSHDLDKKVTQINEQAAKSESGLREQLLSQSKMLMDDAQKKHSEVLGKLENESTEIRNDKADRTHIAQLFTDMALKLTEDLKGTKD